MKTSELILRIAAVALTTAALVCMIMANIDRIAELLSTLSDKLQEKKSRFGACTAGDDAEEYADWGE